MHWHQISDERAADYTNGTCTPSCVPRKLGPEVMAAAFTSDGLHSLQLEQQAAMDVAVAMHAAHCLASFTASPWAMLAGSLPWVQGLPWARRMCCANAAWDH